MKKLLVAGLAVLVLAGSTRGGEFPATNCPGFHAQHQVLGYLVMHLSSINAINGLRLSGEQATALRDLAQELEAVAPGVPDLAMPMRPDLAGVRDTYLEVREALLSGDGEIGKPLRNRVTTARQTQALAARLSLAETPTAAAEGCGRCHAGPAAQDLRDVRAMRNAGAAAVTFKWPRREVFLAHQVGVFERRGAVADAPALFGLPRRAARGTFFPNRRLSPEAQMRVGRASARHLSGKAKP